MAQMQIAIDILARNKAKAALNDTARSLDRVGKQAEKSSRSMADLGKKAAAGAAVLGTGAVFAGKKVFDLAAKMELMDKKAGIVFGDQIGSVQKWAKVNARAMGLTSKEAVGLAADFSDLLIPMGFTRKAAVQMSTKIVGLSGALAEWSGGTRTAAEVSTILAKAMLGERDGLKELGISISDADVKQRLLVMGKSKLIGAALQQATAMATEQLIMEKSTDAQAAYAKGAGTLARKKAEATAALKEFRDKGVAAAMPHLLRFATFIETKVVPWVSTFVAQMRNGTGPGGEFARAMQSVGAGAQKVGAFLLPIGRWMVEHPDFMVKVAAGAALLNVQLRVMAGFTALRGMLLGIAAAETAVGVAGAGAAGKVGLLNKALARFLPLLPIVAAIDMKGDKFGTGEAAKDEIRKWRDQGLLDIPKKGTPAGQAPAVRNRGKVGLAEGGIVKRRPGGIDAVIGEGRHDEAVIPLDGKRGLGGGDVNLYVTGVIDDVMVRKLETMLAKVQRERGTRLAFM